MNFDPLIYLELVINGIIIGTVYGLIACGLSLIFGVGKIVNFAHGALLALGMFIVYFLHKTLGVSVYAVILPAAFLMFGLGYGMQALLIRPIIIREKGIPVLPVILLTAGIMMSLENFLLLAFGSSYLTVKMDLAQRTLRVGEMSLPLVRLIAFFSSLVVVAALNLFLSRTDTGRAMRAVSQDREKARLLGIDDQKILCLTVGLGAAITTISGGTLLPFYYVHPDIGNMFLTKCFVIVVLGGLGTISGALAGGVIVGILEVVMAQFMKVSAVQGLIFIIFVFVLLVRPSGLLGTEKE
jgi:branched-chain amino acid transport system permease protein